MGAATRRSLCSVLRVSVHPSNCPAGSPSDRRAPPLDTAEEISLRVGVLGGKTYEPSSMKLWTQTTPDTSCDRLAAMSHRLSGESGIAQAPGTVAAV